MEENNDSSTIESVVNDIRNTNDEQLKETISKWFEQTRTDGMRIGAKFISAGVYAAIKKNINKPGKVSLNDYRRCIKDIMKIIDVQLKTKQNDTEEQTTEEE